MGPDFQDLVEPASPANKGWSRYLIGKGMVLGAVLLLVPICFSLWLYLYAVSDGPQVGDPDVRVYIPPGSGVRQIGTLLAEAGVVDGGSRFLLLAKVMGVARHLKAGEYSFAGSPSPYQILNDLSSGKTVLRPITIPEGTNIYQMADLLSGQGWSDHQDFLSLVKSPPFLKELNLPLESLEGYLFPDTYYFPKGEDLKKIVKKMVERARLVVAEECNPGGFKGVTFNCERAADQTLSPVPDSKPGSKSGKNQVFLSNHQVLTLASIVEKETGLADERPLVSRVFLNRLLTNMKLQADPTVIYGLKKFGTPLSKKDLKTAGPYNTYVGRGLPVGPICSPGRASIAAVFKPSEESYLYFVSQSDGSHYFSKTLKEHNRAVKRFRQASSEN